MPNPNQRKISWWQGMRNHGLKKCFSVVPSFSQNLESGYMCACPAGFEGAHCEHSQPTCADQPCFHSGKCWEKDNGRSYMCECPRGYTGLNCEKRVDKCTTLPCANGTAGPPHLSPHCSTSSYSPFPSLNSPKWRQSWTGMNGNSVPIVLVV